MANEKQLNILKRGVESWNEMRRRYPKVNPDLSNADLEFASLEKANLRRTNLKGANLLGAYLTEAKLKEAQLDNAILGLTNLNFANFNDASLWRVSLSEAIICDAHFCGADLNSANFHDSDLSRSNFYGANLTFANFGFANLDGADFSKAKIGWTTFGNNDLSTVKGLDTVEHAGPSIIGIDTLFKSKGKIPKLFLRRLGVPDNFTNRIASLLDKEIQFYSCFISFTEADDKFAERLYNDLLEVGVRCWRWKEDAKWGKSLMRSIDEAVSDYDKLIVICSGQSLKSPAVIREIERALQKEDDLVRQGVQSEVLFPVRLDDYIFSEWNHHRKADVVAKNIGDFRIWKNPNSYRKGFERLIHDLQADDSTTHSTK
ncbi:MAG TPA: toll/interleukin-1 receptor domain-containing protein, partial [Nitrososphaera sp.]|nr:toll/interleukin-1 receptor domain-containing protein [Nitrososphaera sp.]